MRRWTKKVSRELFEKIVKNGKTYDSTYLSFVFYQSSGIINNPTVFVVSKKIEKKAVTRNLIKRRGKHAFKNLLKGSKEPFASIFYTKKGVSNISFIEFQKEIENLLKKAKILN